MSEEQKDKVATAEILLGRKPTRDVVAIELDDGQRVTVTFESIGRAAFETLVQEHTPDPTDDVPHPEENIETLAPYLLSACAVEPKLTLEDAQQIWNTWTRTDAVSLYRAAIRANLASRVHRLGEG